MSGGHWNYLGYRIEERASYNNVWRLIAYIEHTLDRGICHDDCNDCAERNVIEALKTYFDHNAESVEEALAELRVFKRCERCKGLA